MNEIVNEFLLAGDKYIPEMQLRQPGFTQSACRPFTKSKEKTQKLKKSGDSQYIYQNELLKACFQHDMSYGDFKDSTKVQLLTKHLILLRIQNIMDIKGVLLQWFINLLINAYK